MPTYVILRRAAVAVAILGSFLAWGYRPAPLSTQLLIVGAVLFAGLVIGTVLSWPRQRWSSRSTH
ncbi:MAG TPA: hypothetical protein VM733_05370 [Thermoanaerobaculia bacterium]|nr:hypothetical protein [Thermoanaerobaculia bacterium]